MTQLELELNLADMMLLDAKEELLRTIEEANNQRSLLMASLLNSKLCQAGTSAGGVSPRPDESR